jgi:hypothetical protein
VGLLAVWAFAASCHPGHAEIIGVWRNQTNQIISVGSDLNGVLTQSAACAPLLTMHVNRDPYDNYALEFDLNQRVYFPPAERMYFGSAEYFCSSDQSVPMCRFCEVRNEQMNCQTTEQNITGYGQPVVHNCTWVRLSTTAAPREMGPGAGCPKAQAGCPIDTIVTSTGTDAGTRD